MILINDADLELFRPIWSALRYISLSQSSFKEQFRDHTWTSGISCMRFCDSKVHIMICRGRSHCALLDVFIS